MTRQAFQSGFSRVAEALSDPAREAIVSALADGKAMPAGAYTVSASRLAGGSLVFRLTNEDSNRSVMTAPYAQSSQKHGATAAWLAFQCAGDRCALIQIAAGRGETYQIPQPRMSGEGARLAVIHAVLVNAE